MESGLQFVNSLLLFTGSVFIATGLALWMFETGPEEGMKNTRRRLGESWRKLAEAPWGRVPECLTGWLVAKLENLVSAGFRDADRGIAFGGLVFGFLFFFIPLAALVNMLLGGSAFLFLYYLALLAALVFLNFAGETGRLRFLTGLAAVFLGVSLFAVVPIYVLRSFTEVTIHSPGFLKSLLVALFWYVAAYGIGLILDAGLRFRGLNPGRLSSARFAHGFLAALPLAYVLTFLGLQAGQLAVMEQSPAQTWQLALLSIGFTALSLPLTLRIMSGGPGFNTVAGAYGLSLVAAAGLSMALAYGIRFGTTGALGWGGAANLFMGLAPDGGRVYLGADFWVTHLPFLPLLGFLFAVLFGFVAKGAVLFFNKVAGPGASFDQPFLTSALSCGGISVLFFGAALLV